MSITVIECIQPTSIHSQPIPLILYIGYKDTNIKKRKSDVMIVMKVVMKEIRITNKQ